MPRLRHYKNFEEIGEDNNELGQTLQNNNGLGKREGYYSNDSPKGWWSNGNIISGLSNNQIERNIQYHKQQIKILEEVLQDRALGLRVYIPYNVQNIRQTEESELQNVHQIQRKEIRYIMKDLLPILKSIRKKYGTNTFEFCRDAWLEILEDYYSNERS